MGKTRRIQLSTQSALAGLTVTSPRVTPALLLSSQAEHSDSDSNARLVLTLFEPDEQNFPEFNYTELLKSTEVPLHRVEEEELKGQQELCSITTKLEEKYGGMPKKQTDRIQDLIDIGYGYDEEDSFIDNSEPYDEFVPSSITTKLGGFYVNSGVLQFKAASDTNTGEHHPRDRRREPSKKRKLNGAHEPEMKRCNDKFQAAEQSSLSSESVEGNPSKQRTTNELKKFKKRRKGQRWAQASRGLCPGTSTLALGPADAAGGNCMPFTEPLLQEGPTLNYDSDCVVVISDNSSFSESLSPASPDGLSTTSCVPTASKDSLGAAGTKEAVAKEKPSTKSCVSSAPKHKLSAMSSIPATFKEKLSVATSVPGVPKELITNVLPTSTPTDGSPQAPPLTIAYGTMSDTRVEDTIPLAWSEGFPPGLEKSINRLLLATKASEANSKTKYYTPEINNILLEIDAMCRKYGGPLRSMVFHHLCSFLPCSKKTLLQRVNKLKNSRSEEEKQLKILREAIKKTMPKQMLQWKTVCEANQLSVIAAEECEVEEGKKKGPKKHFQWTEEIRENLGQLLKLKLVRYHRDYRNQDMDQSLSSLLDDEVKPLWPKGWMTSRVLLKESRKLLHHGATQLKNSAKQSTSDTPCNSTVQPLDVLYSAPCSDPAPSIQPHSSSRPKHLCPRAPPPTLLVAAVARYKQNVLNWEFNETTGSPPVPPPPPQSSPISFLLAPPMESCQMTLSQITLGQEPA